MNIGSNLYDWFSAQSQMLVLVALIVMALYLGFKREFTKLIGWLILSVVIIVMIYDTGGFADKLLELGRKMLDIGTGE